ncbi:MAG: hypothetical protein IJG56_04900, partial [Clostridia bacterium]|nr:hypothetical protein [Clostridia bacterium]
RGFAAGHDRFLLFHGSPFCRTAGAAISLAVNSLDVYHFITLFRKVKRFGTDKSKLGIYTIHPLLLSAFSVRFSLFSAHSETKTLFLLPPP